MKELVEKINAACAEFAKNAEAQVVKGNKAAGARARKAALELMKDLNILNSIINQTQLNQKHKKKHLYMQLTMMYITTKLHLMNVLLI